MLGKLLKYEIKATARTFLPLYLAILLAAAGMRFVLAAGFIPVVTILGFVLFGLFVALAVLTIVITVQRFQKNLLSTEGYLMFTLPVTPASLVSSKLLASLLWAVLTCVVTVACFFVIVIDGRMIQEFGLMTEQIWQVLQNGFQIEAGEAVSILIGMIVSMFCSYTTFILNIYASLSVGQRFDKSRTAASFVTFMLVYIVYGILSYFLGEYVFANMSFTTWMWAAIGVELVVSGALFAFANYNLSRHLNLE